MDGIDRSYLAAILLPAVLLRKEAVKFDASGAAHETFELLRHIEFDDSNNTNRG